jgi:hypothetical protein
MAIRRSKPLERQIQAGVLDLLRLMPEVAWVHKVFTGDAVIIRPHNGESVRNQLQPAINLGIIRRSQVGWIQGAPEGTLDIALQLSGMPHHCELEVKVPGHKPTEAQEARIAMVRKHGGLAGWVSDIEEAQKLIREWSLDAWEHENSLDVR